MIRSREYGESGRRAAPQQKVPGEVDAFDVHARPPRDFHVDERQRDRNAGPPIEHLVQEAVARILVLDVVADEPLFVEQVLVERRDARERLGIDARRGTSRRDRAPPRPAAPPRGRARRADRDTGPASSFGYVDARDHQRRDREIGIGAERDLREARGAAVRKSRGKDSAENSGRAAKAGAAVTSLLPKTAANRLV